MCFTYLFWKLYYACVRHFLPRCVRAVMLHMAVVCAHLHRRAMGAVNIPVNIVGGDNDELIPISNLQLLARSLNTDPHMPTAHLTVLLVTCCLRYYA